MENSFIKRLNDNEYFELTDEEIRMLYGIDNEFNSSYIDIISKRDIYKDLCRVFKKKNIARTINELNVNTICYIGDLVISKDLPTYNLRYIYGNFTIVTNSINNLENLELIMLNAYFIELESAKGLENLKYIGQSLSMNEVKNSEGLECLEYVGNSITMVRLKSAEGLENLKYVGNHAEFYELESAKGLQKLEYIGGVARFDELRNNKGLENIKSIFGNNIDDINKVAFNLNELTTDTEFFSGSLYVHSDEPINNLRYVIGNFLYYPEDIENLFNLEYVKGRFICNNVRSVEIIKNLKYIYGDACFKNLENIKGLEKIIYIENLFLSNISVLDNLTNVENIYLDNVRYIRKNKKIK